MNENTPLSTYVEHPSLFEWHENQVQDSLQLLHDHEASHRAELVEIMHDLKQSPKFWQLNCCFEDALFKAKQRGDGDAYHGAILAMCARMYVAGNLRRNRVLEDVNRDCAR